MTAEVFVPRGYVSKTFWPTASPIKSDDKHRNVTMVDIQPFSVYQQDNPHTLRKRGSHYGAMPRCRANATESLDLVRTVLQPAINYDIVEVFKKYLSVYRDAAENVVANMQAEPFSTFTPDCDLNASTMVYKLCCDALDHCKTLFEIAKPANVTQTPPESSKVPTSVPSSKASLVASSLPNRLMVKRVPSPDFPWSKRLAKSSPRRSLSPTPRAKRSRPNTSRRYGSPLHAREQAARENWDPDRLTTDTKFIMGTRANKALGLGATRGRIYMKHPELFKYSSDPEDKKWMVKNNCMMATGGKNTFILIADDIYDLLENEYKESPHVIREEMQVFKLPEFILQKMRNLMGKEKKLALKLASKPTPPKSDSQTRSAESSPCADAKSARHSPSPVQHSRRTAAEKATAVIIATSQDEYAAANTSAVRYIDQSDPDSSSIDDGSGSDYDGDAGRHRKN